MTKNILTLLDQATLVVIKKDLATKLGNDDDDLINLMIEELDEMIEDQNGDEEVVQDYMIVPV